MNINRHNYEEFFLLYVDNELTPVQRAEVDAFLKTNPDLQEELVMFQQVVLTDEQPVEFNGKADLFKTEQGISLTNYEEYFLLYVDDELTPAQKQDVEQFVLTHPPLQDAFTQLRATKLQPEVIEFKNKESLYRKEKERRVIPFNWMRMAAAAAVIGLITLLWINKSTDNIPTGGTENIAQQKITPPAVDSKTPGNPIKTGEEVIASSASQIVKDKPVVSVQSSQKVQASKNNITPVDVMPENKINQSPVEERSSLAKVDIVPEIRKANPIVDPGIEKSSGISQPTLVSNTSNEKNVVEQAVYREADEEEDDRTIYIAGAEINKNKLRGLFKKASNFFDKKVKKADKANTVQIASFEIKTK